MPNYHVNVSSLSRTIDFTLIDAGDVDQSDKTVEIGGVRYSVVYDRKDSELIDTVIRKSENLKLETPKEIGATFDHISDFDGPSKSCKVFEETFHSKAASSSQISPKDTASGIPFKPFKNLDRIAEGDYDAHRYLQIQVLNQLQDGTGHGVENCGYHALKNAIASLLLNSPHENAAHCLLKEKPYFKQFFDTYCSQLIAMSTDKDASIPLLNEIIDRFLKDDEVPVKLTPFQTALRANREQVVIINTSTSGNPFTAFISEEGLKEAEKIFNFINNPKSEKLTIIFGNENENHWFTLTAEKTHDEKIKFTCFDSFEGNHSRAGKDSPFYKASQTFKQFFELPQKCIENAVFDLNEVLERKAAWIGEDSEDLLTNDQETIQRQCLRCYDIIKQHKWLASNNIQKQMCVSNIHKLLSFYHTKTPNPEFSMIIEEIDVGRNKDWLIQTLDELIQEISSNSDSYTPPLNEQALNVAKLGLWLKKLYSEREKIRDNPSLQQALQVEMSIEDKFSDNPVKEMERNVLLYILTIQTAQKKNRLNELIQNVGTPSCFTGRMGAISEFLPRLQWSELDELAVAGYTFLTTDVAFSHAILECIPIDSDDHVAEGMIDKFSTETCKQNKEEFVMALNLFGKGKRAKPFYDFLLREGIVEKLPIEDWSPVVDKLFDSKFLPEILSRAKTQAKRDFLL